MKSPENTLAFVTCVFCALLKLSQPQPPLQECDKVLDIFFVLVASDSMVNIPTFLLGLKGGMRAWADQLNLNPTTGQQVAICLFGDSGNLTSPLMPFKNNGQFIRDIETRIFRIGGFGNLDFGIQCAMDEGRNSRTNAVKVMVIIAAENAWGRFTQVDVQADTAKANGFFITAIAVTNGVTLTNRIENLASLPGYFTHILPNFADFESAARSGSLFNWICPPDAMPAPTNPPSPTPRVLVGAGGLCNGCMIVNGIGYNFHPDDCRKYVQCFFSDADGTVTGSHIQWVPLGEFWNNMYLVHELASAVTCANDPCTLQPALQFWPDERNCRGTWVCSGGFTQGFQCCSNGERWSTVTNQCVPDPGAQCTTVCGQPESELTTTTPAPCPYSLGNPQGTEFILVVGDYTHTFSCIPGYGFSTQTCGCHLKLTDLPIPQVCEPDLHVVFDNGRIEDISRNMYQIVNVNGGVRTQKFGNQWYGVFDAARFTDLMVPGLANIDFQSTLAILVRFNSDNHLNGNAALASSSDCNRGRGPYALHLGASSTTTSAFLQSEYHRASFVETASASSLGAQDNTAVFMFDGQSLNLTVNNGPTASRFIQGTVWHRGPTCAFHIGWGQNFNHFTGRIAEVRLYKCIPTQL